MTPGAPTVSTLRERYDCGDRALYIATDPPPAKQYKNIGELLGLHCTSRRAQRGFFKLRVMAMSLRGVHVDDILEESHKEEQRIGSSMRLLLRLASAMSSDMSLFVAR